MKNVTDFCKTTGTGVDPHLKNLQATMSSKWESSLVLINIHCDQNIDIDIVVDQFAGKHAWHHLLSYCSCITPFDLTLLTELDMRS